MSHAHEYDVTVRKSVHPAATSKAPRDKIEENEDNNDDDDDDEPLLP
jgi:hypothetical protein